MKTKGEQKLFQSEYYSREYGILHSCGAPLLLKNGKKPWRSKICYFTDIFLWRQQLCDDQFLEAL